MAKIDQLSMLNHKKCYEEGISIGFVPCIGYNEKIGVKEYGKCPGEEHRPGQIDQKCRKCLYLQRSKKGSGRK